MTNKEAIFVLKKELDGIPSDIDKSALEKAVELAIKALEERPQGEWLTHRVAFHLTCPFCGCNLRALKDKVFEGDYEYNFCPNCGADMRGGNNND